MYYKCTLKIPLYKNHASLTSPLQHSYLVNRITWPGTWQWVSWKVQCQHDVREWGVHLCTISVYSRFPFTKPCIHSLSSTDEHSPQTDDDNKPFIQEHSQEDTSSRSGPKTLPTISAITTCALLLCIGMVAIGMVIAVIATCVERVSACLPYIVGKFGFCFYQPAVRFARSRLVLRLFSVFVSVCASPLITCSIILCRIHCCHATLL